MSAIVMGGSGQVGSALVEILESKGKDVFIIDKADDNMEPPERLKYDFLHVAIPYGDHFLNTVKNAVSKYDPAYVIVHSTVPVGTTRQIGSFAAHSPIRGNHPNLKGGILKFVKYLGAHNPKTRMDCGDHLAKLGLNVELCNKAEDTELMKLLCLSRYLNDLAFYETAFKACKKFGVAPINMVQWTYTYNDGYKGTKYVRPELTFPMGKVGGHCVVPVAKMLARQVGVLYTRKSDVCRFLRKNLDVFAESV